MVTPDTFKMISVMAASMTDSGRKRTAVRQFVSPMPPIVDQRQAPRARIRIKGIISCNGGTTTLRCVVRDYSERGARIVVHRGAKLSDELLLIMNGRRIAHLAEVVWHGDCQAGLKFIRAIELNDSMGDDSPT